MEARSPKDRLRECGYEQDLARRIAGSKVRVFEGCGHCPNLEQPERFCELAIEFLSRVHQRQADRIATRNSSGKAKTTRRQR